MSSLFDCRDDSQLLPGLREARRAIARGELVVLPTDTVYGVAADAFDAAAVQRLLDAKGRGRQSPPPVLVPGVNTLRALVADVPEPVERLVDAFWPGGLTIVLPAQPSLSWDLGETHGTVAVRMPASRIALELLEETGPLAVSSANLTGKSAAIMIDEARTMLGDSVSVYLDGGHSDTGISSTIVDATSLVGGTEPRVRILRHGAIERERLLEVLGDLLEPDDAPTPQRRKRVKQYVFVIILTATITFALSWGVWRLSLRYKLYAGIRERDVHKTPTPRLGGIAMFLGVAAAFLVSGQHPFFSLIWAQPERIWALLAATLLIVVVGVADDLWDLDWMIKLGAQFLAAGIIAWFGKLQILSLPIGGIAVVSGWVSFTLTVFAIVVVMNAVNFIDGLDGLVAGVCLIANGVFFAYSYLLVRDTGASTYFNLASFIAAVLIGACIGFLPMNWSPAKLFMGDSGALMLGLLMATSAIAITGQLQPSMIDPDEFGRSQLLGAFIPILLPIVVVLLPLLDFGLAVVRRVSKGKSPFSPDRKHLHHRMLDMGHSDRDAVIIFYAWTTVVSLAFLLMYVGTQSDWPGEYLLGVVFGVVGIAACLVLTFLPSRRRSALPATPHVLEDAR